MKNPLVTVIIPSYNHAEYLKKAINSVIIQSYSNIEIIVMDDGSIDHTKEVVSKYPNVIYIYQNNAGLSAARNNAIQYSKGKFLLFLDADDWLYPEAIKTHLKFLLNDPSLFFVSGGHNKVFVDKHMLIQNADYDILEDNFRVILKAHYISHPAAVLFRRVVFEKYQFDSNLKSCQDYDLYLTVSRNHKVLHHSELVSAYRLHSSNMSSNHAFMLYEILQVLEKHKTYLKSEEDLEAYTEGKRMFINYYTKALYWDKLRKKKIKATKEEKEILKKYNPSLYLRYLGNSLLNR